MKLSETRIKQIIKGEVDSWIITARADAKLLRLHYYGTGLDEWLEKVEDLESENQINLRRRFAISNTFLNENLLRPLDNIFKAKGGSEKIDLPTEALTKTFKEGLKDIKAGLSNKQYIKEIWKDHFIVDPNGLMFLEVSQDGEKSYFTQKTIFNIRNMRIHGMNPEYVVFEPDVTISDTEKSEKESKGIEFFWVVDSEFYYRVKKKGETVTIITEEPDKDDPIAGITTPNAFKMVPAISNSTIIDTDRKIKISPIWKQIELMNSYVIDNSIKEIFKKKFGFPIFWMYSGKKTVCTICGGSGKAKGDDEQSRGFCTSCNGTGQLTVKRDVSDVHLINPPRSKDDPIIDKIAGSVSPPVDSWKMMNEELDRTWDLIFFSHWGTTTEKHGSSRETATGRFIDVQPVDNKLNAYADIRDFIHTEMIKLWARKHAQASVEANSFRVTISGGRRFLIETPDRIWQKYLTAKEKKAPVSTLDLLLAQFYESEFQSNDMLQQYYLQVMRIEPFVHMTVQEVQALATTDAEKLAKIYFSDWLKTKPINEVIDKEVPDLLADLAQFVSNKTVTQTE